MRPAPTSVALWTVIAVAAAAGGAATVLATGTAATPVLTPEQVAEELAAQDEPATGGPSGRPRPAGDTAQTKTTEAGTVTVTCDGEVITAETVTPASGWDVGDPAGHDRKREVEFTTDRPTATTAETGGDSLIVTYVCFEGEAAFDSRFE